MFEHQHTGDLPIAPTLTTDPIFIDLKQHIMYMSQPHPPHYQVKYDHDQQIIHPYTTHLIHHVCYISTGSMSRGGFEYFSSIWSF